ncbi:MAG: ornithine cyclodeaminase family protein [Suipraeoptans sp.]
MIFIDKDKIEEIVNLQEMMNEMEHAFSLYKSGDFFMPERPFVENDNKKMIYMPCYTKDVIGTKILSIFPDNAKLNLPAIDGVILLNDYTTGKPIALLDGQSVTAFRTGAVGGVGIRHLSRKDASSVGIVGAGTQGFYQALYACAARPIKTVYIYNHSDRDLSEYAARLKSKLTSYKSVNSNIEIIVCKEVRELVQKSDIICTATLSNTPVLPDDKDLLKGKCIIAVGSYTPDYREIPDAVFDLIDKVYIELPYAMEESGDLAIPLKTNVITKDKVALISDYLADNSDKEIKEGETTYFKSVGMALFDICASRLLLEKAKEN